MITPEEASKQREKIKILAEKIKHYKVKEENIKAQNDKFLNLLEKAADLEISMQNAIKDLEKRLQSLSKRNDQEMEKQLNTALTQAKLDEKRSKKIGLVYAEKIDSLLIELEKVRSTREDLEIEKFAAQKDLAAKEDLKIEKLAALDPHPEIPFINKQMVLLQKVLNSQTEESDLQFTHKMGTHFPGEQFRFSMKMNEMNNQDSNKFKFFLGYIKFFENLGIHYDLGSKKDEFVLILKKPDPNHKNQERIINLLTPEKIQEAYSKAFSEKGKIRNRVKDELEQIQKQAQEQKEEYALLSNLKKLIKSQTNKLTINQETSGLTDKSFGDLVPGQHIRVSGNSKELLGFEKLAGLKCLSIIQPEDGKSLYILINKPLPKKQDLEAEFRNLFQEPLIMSPKEPIGKTESIYSDNTNKTDKKPQQKPSSKR